MNINLIYPLRLMIKVRLTRTKPKYTEKVKILLMPESSYFEEKKIKITFDVSTYSCTCNKERAFTGGKAMLCEMPPCSQLFQCIRKY